MKINLPYYGECDDEQVGYLLFKLSIERERLQKYSDAFDKAKDPLEKLATKESFEMIEDLRNAYNANRENVRSVILKTLGRFFKGTPLI
ncbi:hypothetical protein [uncultured Bacteroides sp.]|uniref:hypothetical protein n=1 Tax=uncultured Bacteroides sp. TaxID=162156 RepID=UPI0026104C00|nr:hypothetical protein [uncultured Bacteroides sp.]